MTERNSETPDGVTKFSRREFVKAGSALLGVTGLSDVTEAADFSSPADFKGAYIGPDADKTGLGAKGWLYFADDSGARYKHNGSGWQLLDLKAGTINAEQLSRETVFALQKGLAADGATDDSSALQSIIENNEGKDIVIEEDTGAINIDGTVAPTTTGKRTQLHCVGTPLFNITGATSPALNFINYWLPYGRLEDIDNSQASSPSTQFSLNVHRHSGEGDVRNIHFGSWQLINCAAGFIATNNDTDGLATQITADRIYQRNTAFPVFRADYVRIGEFYYTHSSVSDNHAIRLQGGNSHIETLYLDVPGFRDHISVEAPSSIAHGTHVIENVPDAAVTSNYPDTGGINVEQNADARLVVENYRPESTMVADGLKVRDSGLSGDDSVFEDCLFLSNNQAIDMTSTGNSPIVMRGGRVEGSVSAKVWSRLKGVEGVSLGDVGRVYVNGVTTGAYTGDGTTGRTISTSRPPSLVIIEGSDGTIYSAARGLSGSPMGTDPSGELSIGSSGFTVGDDGADADPNTNGESYSYRVAL